MLSIKRITQDDKGGPYVYIGIKESILFLDFTERKRVKANLAIEPFPQGAEDLSMAEVNNLFAELNRASIAWKNDVADIGDGISTDSEAKNVKADEGLQNQEELPLSQPLSAPER
jgi:hypothetical protein